jgi:hypothetical protein
MHLLGIDLNYLKLPSEEMERLLIYSDLLMIDDSARITSRQGRRSEEIRKNNM